MAKAKRRAVSAPASQACARVFDALGSPVRREIVAILSGGACTVREIAEQLPVSRPAVSRHLRLLEDAALVAYEQRGTSNVYRLEPRGFSAARRWLDAFWDEAIARFALLAGNLPDPHRSSDPDTDDEADPS
jgi:DNA-binding transcriptional ArsR family regulator